MVKRRFLLLHFLLSLVLLAGCWDSKEPDKMVYAQGIGVDYKDGKYFLFLQMLNLSTLAKSDSAGNIEEMKPGIGHSSGFSLEDALFNLYKRSQRHVHFGHLNYIFLTKNALNQGGLQDVTDLFDRFFGTHYRMWIYFTDEPLGDVLTTEPPLEMSTYFSRIANPEEAFEQASNIQPLDMREVIVSHHEPPHEINVPLVSINKSDWKKSKEIQEVGVINGIGVITNNRLKGKILNEDISGYKWVGKKFKRMGISLKVGENSTVGLTVKKRKVRIKPVIVNDQLQFDIHIKVNATINKLNKNVSVERLSKQAEELIKAEVQTTFTKALEIDSDIYRLSEVLYKKNHAQWKKRQKEGRLPLEKDSIRKIDVDAKIIDSGNHWKIPTLKVEN